MSNPGSLPPNPAPDAKPAAPTAATPQTPSGPTINIADEFGTAKRNLPPAKMLLIAIGVVLVVVAIASFVKRAKPQAGGTLDNVTAVEIPGQTSTMVALTFTVRNTSEKMLYVHALQGKLTTVSGENTADAVSAVDFERYFQAFPDLKNGAQTPLAPEDKIPAGQTATRTIIVAFPVTLASFNQRKSVGAVIDAYNYTVPIVLTK